MAHEILTAVPAYGRDYKNVADINRDWLQGKDFQISQIGHNGEYFSIRDTNKLIDAGYAYVNVRYLCLSKVHVIKLDI